MNDYLLSILLGAIEGLTEFLPVSSTAHLRIAEALFQIDLQNGFWKMYSVVIQLGAILALTAFFLAPHPEISRARFPRGARGDRTVLTHPLSLVLIAFIVTAIPAFLLSKLIGKNLENLHVMAFALLIGGIVMWLVDSLFVRPNIQQMDETNLPTAIWIGAVQVLSAVFPGTSRSMCTIAAGQVAGMSREAALEFSFFLSIPTMFVATGYDLLKTIKPHTGDRRNRAARNDAAALDRARDRVRHRLRRRARGRRLVSSLGAAAWFHALRHLPNRARPRPARGAQPRIAWPLRRKGLS